jgi:hypothetical protein
MLIVLSQEKKRASSGILRGKFQDFYSKCLDKNPDYCLKGIPEFRLKRAQTAVEATLNETAREKIMENPTDLEVEIHEGKTNKALGEKALENIDET